MNTVDEISEEEEEYIESDPVKSLNYFSMMLYKIVETEMLLNTAVDFCTGIDKVTGWLAMKLLSRRYKRLKKSTLKL